MHADVKPVRLWQHAYYAIEITASQYLDKPTMFPQALVQSCNCEFVANR